MYASPPLNAIKVKCVDSPHLARFCIFENMVMDFTKMENVRRSGRTDSRKWSPGFLSTHCDVRQHGDIGYYEVCGMVQSFESNGNVIDHENG
jgi:hypothetical protein